MCREENQIVGKDCRPDNGSELQARSERVYDHDEDEEAAYHPHASLGDNSASCSGQSVIRTQPLGLQRNVPVRKLW
jgi:hypothetical protein